MARRRDRDGGWLTWSGVWGLPGVGNVERRLLDQWWWVHAPADEEAGSAAEEHSHHQEEPEEDTSMRLELRAQEEDIRP
jgi:hypothetical protein